MSESIPVQLLQELGRLEKASFANEAEVETKLLLHIFRLLGYTDADRADKPPIEMYFGHEKRTKYPDFVLYEGKERSVSNALVTIEAKGTSEAIASALPQATSYALWAGTPFYVACNGVSLIAVQFVPATNDHRILEVQVSDLTSRWNELVMFLSRVNAILAKERLAYTALYLPKIEQLPPRQFFREYLKRIAQRFSNDDAVAPIALDAARQRLHFPRIEVHVRFEGPPTIELDDSGMFEFGLSEGARVVISGAAGSGKSTLLGRIAHRAAQMESSENPALPVFLRLSGGIPESVESAFAIACDDIGIRVLPNLYRLPIAQSHVLLLLDGLDEVDLSEENLARLKRLVDGSGRNAIIMATREAAIGEVGDAVRWERFEKGEVTELSDNAVRNMFRAYLGERADAVLNSIPLEIRESLSSPLLALMTIRVAQSVSDWTSFTPFRLFKSYVEALDQFFNAATVRGGLGATPGRAVEDLRAAAVMMAAAEREGGLSLDTLAAALRSQDHEMAVPSLVNIGLLTSSHATARFTHQLFADFGQAYEMLESIRTEDLARFTAVIDSSGADDLLHSELVLSDEETLVQWLTIDSAPLHNRVYRILRRGCSTSALSAVREIWRQSGMIGRLQDTAEILAAHGDFEFLSGYERHIHGSSETARSRILARVLSRPGRPEYFDTILSLARSKKKLRYVVVLLRVAFDLNRRDALDEVVENYPDMDRRMRVAIAKRLTSHRRSVEFPHMLNSLLQIERDPEVIFLLLYAGRDAVSLVKDPALVMAANSLADLGSSHPYQSMLANSILDSLGRSPVKTKAVQALMLECSRIASSNSGLSRLVQS